MGKQGTEQHFFTVRGRGFDHKQWKAITELSQGIIARAKEAGIQADFSANDRRILISSVEEGVTPLIIWRKGEPGIPKEVTTRGGYDTLVQSVLTATKKVAPDIFEITSPDGRDYRRLLAKGQDKDPAISPKKQKESELPEIKEIRQQNRKMKDDAFRTSVKRQKWPNPDFRPGTKKQRFIEFSTLPKKEQTKIRHQWDAEYGRRFDERAELAIKKIREAQKARTEAERENSKAQEAAKKFKNKAPQGKKATIMTEDSIRKAAIRVAAATNDPNLKLALLEILRDTVDNGSKKAKTSEEDEKMGRHEEGKSIDVGDYLKSKGHHGDADKWEKHEGEVGKKSSVAVVFPEIFDLAWRHVIDFSKHNTESKVASGSTAQRVAATTRLATQWIQKAIENGVADRNTFSADKLAENIKRAQNNKPLLASYLFIKRLNEMGKKEAAEDSWLNEESFTKAATEIWGAQHLAKQWISDAIKHPGRVREYLKIPEGKDIPMSKLDEAIEKVKSTDNKSLLSALLLAKRLKKMNK